MKPLRSIEFSSGAGNRLRSLPKKEQEMAKEALFAFRNKSDNGDSARLWSEQYSSKLADKEFHSLNNLGRYGCRILEFTKRDFPLIMVARPLGNDKWRVISVGEPRQAIREARSHAQNAVRQDTRGRVSGRVGDAKKGSKGSKSVAKQSKRGQDAVRSAQERARQLFPTSATKAPRQSPEGSSGEPQTRATRHRPGQSRQGPSNDGPQTGR